MKALALGAVALLLWDPLPARAGSCSGGDGDGGSSDSGSSSSSSSDGGGGDYTSSAVTYEEPPCVETSDVLGRRQCSGFGTWEMAALPAMSIEVGTSVRSISLAALSLNGRIDHGDEGTYSYRMVEGGGDAGGAAAVGFDLRILGGRRAYGGAEFSLGGISADESRMQMEVEAPPRATLEPTVQLHYAMGGVAGARWSAGPLQVSGEVFAGARMIQVELESHYGVCDTTDYDRTWSAVLEPRARLDWWVTPWTTLGAFAGTDVLSSSRVVGVSLGGHTRAFDALR